MVKVNIKLLVEDIYQNTRPGKRVSIIDTNYENCIRWINGTELDHAVTDWVELKEIKEYPARIDLVISPEDYDKLAEEIF